MSHTPVLLQEVLEYLKPAPGNFIIDGTIDGGGHAREILKGIGSHGKLLGIEWDESLLACLKKDPAFGHSAFIGVNANYAETREILERKKLGLADGLLLDLGFSSEQLGESGRGFSFLKDEPLLMTFDASRDPAYKILSDLHQQELAAILRDYGEERYAGRVAAAIKKHGGIRSSGQLAGVVQDALPRSYEHGRIHPATRTFQALRIYVNRELENLDRILKDIPSLLKPGGRAVVISFHSLEDRVVKNSFRALHKDINAEILTKKPITASSDEMKKNPRSRSAKLRAIKLAVGNQQSEQ